jgi:serine phosphatase RsbU (regulator of sigma subunit)/anti-sigma regulatory factor (Ser/Thr protein kinase)
MARLSRRLRVAPVLASVATASDWVRAFGATAGLAGDDLFRIDLCLTEVLSNAISHGGGGAPIELTAQASERWVRCMISDTGRAFDPLGAALPELPGTLAAAGEGGVGIRLVREFADECRYERRGERNLFTFTLLRAGARGGARESWRERGGERRSAGAAPSFPLPTPAGPVAHERRAQGERRALGFLSRVRLFRGAAYADLEPVIAECPIATLAPGEVWVRPGERTGQLGVVLEGRLGIHVERTDRPADFHCGPGHCVGEMQLLDGKPASAYVVATEATRLLLIAHEVVQQRLLSIPQVARNLMAILAGRIRRSDLLIAERVRAAMELERLQRELRLALDIQTSMLPVPPLFPDLPQVDCAGAIRPARQVGGDFYDAFPLDAARAFLAIGDVCGKGLPAALFMVRALTTLWSETSKRRNPLRIVEQVNRHLCANNDASLFLSLCCGVYDPHSRQFTWVNAGHNPPLVSIGGEPFRWLDTPRNPVTGIVPELAFRAGHTRLPPGSTLVLYTDGVTEAESASGEMYGEERLRHTLDRARLATSAALVASTLAAVDAFTAGAEQSDDITLLAFRAL